MRCTRCVRCAPGPCQNRRPALACPPSQPRARAWHTPRWQAGAVRHGVPGRGRCPAAPRARASRPLALAAGAGAGRGSKVCVLPRASHASRINPNLGPTLTCAAQPLHQAGLAHIPDARLPRPGRQRERGGAVPPVHPVRGRGPAAARALPARAGHRGRAARLRVVRPAPA